MSDIDEVVNLFVELEKRDSARNKSYEQVPIFYGGKNYPDTVKQGYISGVTAATSSIFNPRPSDEDVELRTPINLVKPAI